LSVLRLSTCCSLLTTSHYLPIYYCLLLPLATCCMCRGMQQTCNHKYSYTPLCPPETRSPPQPPPSRRRSRSLSHSPSPSLPLRAWGRGPRGAKICTEDRQRAAPRTWAALSHTRGFRSTSFFARQPRRRSPAFCTTYPAASSSLALSPACLLV